MLASGVLSVAAVMTASPAAAQNLLANPGFEDPITSDGPPFVGSWEGFAGNGATAPANTGTNPRSGAQHVTLNINDVDNAFAGVFQDVEGLVPGQPTVFSGFYMTPSLPIELGTEFRIEWRKVGQAAEVGRTANITIPPTGSYTEFSLPAVVPAGADTARVVFAIQTFGGTSNIGTVFLDDMSFVPEPGSAVALGLAGLGLVARRRRTS
jgi:PEP-CTERM motif